jgi:hypothetical protein
MTKQPFSCLTRKSLLGSFFSMAFAASAVAQAPAPAATPAAPAASPMAAKLDAVIKEHSRDARFKGLSEQQIRDRIEFVAGNVIFATLHEVGHLTVQDLGLPVLGREEDAADSFAVIHMLKVGNQFSDNILIQSARGWFMSDQRAKKQKVPMAFYDEHGLDRQRAYNIVCLMVGGNPEKFSKAAELTKMPEDRQANCQGDFSNASWSWEKALAPHMRKPDQPKVPIAVKYGESEEYAVYARAFREIGLMDRLADVISDRYVLRGPITLETMSCGDPNARWDLPARKIFVCYELAADFADLYGYGGKKTMSKAQAAERSASRKR